MIKMKKASIALMVASIVLANSKVMVQANEEVSVDGIVDSILQEEAASSNLAERLVISDMDKQLYEPIKKLIEEQGIEEVLENYTFKKVPLEEINLEEKALTSLEITQDQYATYLAYELNNEMYHITYYADETINKKITMYYSDEEYIYNQNYNNTSFSFGDSSELDNEQVEEEEDPVIVDLKETQGQLQQRLDVLAVIFSGCLFGVIMFLIWGRKLFTRK